MKKLFLPGFILFSSLLAIMAFTYPVFKSSSNVVNHQVLREVPTFPENIEKILKNSCFDCHSDASSNAKATGKVNFSKWDNLTSAQKVARMQDITDVVKKGDMPPSKYLANYPDRAPSKEQKDSIIIWASEESDKLMGN